MFDKYTDSNSIDPHRNGRASSGGLRVDFHRRLTQSQLQNERVLVERKLLLPKELCLFVGVVADVAAHIDKHREADGVSQLQLLFASSCQRTENAY